MKKRQFPILLVLGCVLILVAFSLLAANRIRAYIGSVNSKNTVLQMETLLPDRTVGSPGNSTNSGMPVLEIDGTDYAALLEIPQMELTIPVADQWNGNRLFDAAARYFGSAYDQTLVIGGADESHQFAFCSKIDNGTTVIITDMTGTQFTYTVTCVERSKKAENQWLINTEYDLTLFCRGTYSTEYIAVRCNLAYS